MFMRWLLVCRFFGAQSLKVALTHHLVARTHSCKGDFRAALQSEKACYDIYKALVSRLSYTLNNFVNDRHVKAE